MEKAVILFATPNLAMWAEDILKEKNVECRLIPVPRELSSDCGYCIRINWGENKEIAEIMRKAEVSFLEIIKI